MKYIILVKNWSKDTKENALLEFPGDSTYVIWKPECKHPDSEIYEYLVKKIDLAKRCKADQIILRTDSELVFTCFRAWWCKNSNDSDRVQISFRPLYTYIPINPTMDKNGRLDFWPEDFFEVNSKMLDILIDKYG